MHCLFNYPYITVLYLRHLFNQPLTSLRGGVVMGGKDFGSFEFGGSGGNPILDRTSLTAARTSSAVSIRRCRTSLLVGCSLTSCHLFRRRSRMSMEIGSPKRTRMFLPVEGRNCGGILCSRMTVSIPEWNMGMT